MIGRTRSAFLKWLAILNPENKRSCLKASAYGAVCESGGEVANCFLRSRIDKNGLSIK